MEFTTWYKLGTRVQYKDGPDSRRGRITAVGIATEFGKLRDPYFEVQFDDGMVQRPLRIDQLVILDKKLEVQFT